MKIVILTALGVGGATAVGAVLGFIFRGVSERVSNFILALSAGVMLCAAMTGLILPAAEFGVAVCVVSVFIGAIVINLLDRAVPRLYGGCRECDRRYERIMLFVTAIAIHNLPEGIAAGVGFGTGDIGDAMLVASGIALHNIPEGMVIISPMLAIGMRPRRVLAIALVTGLFEVVGTLLGYFAVNLSLSVLPYGLAFAGGTMLYVIVDEMIPETHSGDNCRGATYAFLAGFSAMLVLGALMS